MLLRRLLASSRFNQSLAKDLLFRATVWGSISSYAITLLPAQGSARVGVLKPTISAELPNMLDKVPPQMRAQYSAIMAQLQENMKAYFGNSLPAIVQNTWVEMLQRKGIQAVAVDRLPGAGEDVSTQWLLTSAVSVSSSGAMGPTLLQRGIATEQEKRTRKLTVRYSMTDWSGRVLVPPAETTFTSENPIDDIWASAGDAVVAGAASALPLGVQKSESLDASLPPMPSLTGAARFDITTVERFFHKGKEERSGGDDDEKAIVAYANGVVSTQQKKLHPSSPTPGLFEMSAARGVLAKTGWPTFAVVDDTHKAYCVMSESDIAATQQMTHGLQGEASGGGDFGASPSAKLVTMSPDGKRAQYALSPSGGSAEVEFGETDAAWSGGVTALMQVIPGKGSAIGLSPQKEDSFAIWSELARSPRVPRRIVLSSSGGVASKRGDSAITEITIERAEATAADFSIPASYAWHTNPLLQGIFMVDH